MKTTGQDSKQAPGTPHSDRGCGCGSQGARGAVGVGSSPRPDTVRSWKSGRFSDDERLPAASRFVISLRQGLAASVEDAEALLGVLERAAAEASKDQLLIDVFSDRDDEGFRAAQSQVADVLMSAGFAALALGRPVRDSLEPVFVAVAGTDDSVQNLRRTLIGDRPVFEPPKLPPEWLLELGRFIESQCAVAVVKAVQQLDRIPRSTSDARGILSLTQPPPCPGQPLTITGSGFGSTQPTGTEVYVPTLDGACQAATVTSWSDRQIIVTLPSNAGPGCVGFARHASEPVPFEVLATVAGEVQGCLGMAGARWGQHILRTPVLPPPCPPCLPNGANRLATGGAPSISSFAAPAVVEPGDSVQLTWSTTNASRVSLQRASQSGPWPGGPGAVASSGALNLGPFLGSEPTVATYLLVAENACGHAFRTVTVELTRVPAVRITGVEIVQAVQRPDNSVRLVANRATTVRVMIDSGITDGFDHGQGPNRFGGLAITVTAHHLASDTAFDCGAPWNGPYVAHPSPDRNTRDGAAHFDVPLAACQGPVRFEVTVAATVAGGRRSQASARLDATFLPRAPQEVLPLLVRDVLSGAPRPTLADLTGNLEGCQRMQPFGVDGFIVHPPLSLDTPRVVDLTVGLGWTALLMHLNTMVFLFPQTPVSGLRAATVPNNSAYPWGGMAWPRVVLTVPTLICQAGQPSAFAHELSHTYGINHVNACGAGWPYSTLPLVTDQPGIDAGTQDFHPSGTSEMMAYCSPEWVSTAHWDAIFDTAPIS